ncbi:hypothetical protein B0H13DRAFT_2325856 [Mycena leptocephala]|nr:hypothetical protein B0H13DRAFT_2325856 [Mycena leptocephala]
MTTDPPAFEPTSIELQSIKDSKIIAVSLYSTRAEITRLYKFAVQTGQNQVYISGLPNVLEAESLRRSRCGDNPRCDIAMVNKDVPKLSPKLEELLDTRESTANALTRCEEASSSLKQYLGSLTVQNLAVSQLDSVLASEQYESTGARLDAKKIELKRELHSQFPSSTTSCATNIHVDMDAKESPVTIIYKAAVTQNTGESWDNVTLHLETSTPTFGLGCPSSPRGILIYTGLLPQRRRLSLWVQIQVQLRIRIPTDAQKEEKGDLRLFHDQRSNGARGRGGGITGKVSATFRVPGDHVVGRHAEARAQDTSDCAHHKQSEYTLLGDIGNVYVDGSFMARSAVPAVSPQESFDCPLGCVSLSVIFRTYTNALTLTPNLDPSIRITSHPVVKNLSQSGFYKKSVTHDFVQRITIPASRNEQIEIKLVQPPLALGEGTVKPGADARSVSVGARGAVGWRGQT